MSLQLNTGKGSLVFIVKQDSEILSFSRIFEEKPKTDIARIFLPFLNFNIEMLLAKCSGKTENDAKVFVVFGTETWLRK